MDPQVLGYDDNGKPITAAGVVGFDDNGKPISASPAVPHTGLDYYWQAAKDVGEGIGTSVKKTVDAINPFADRPARPTREQEAARLDAELKKAPPLNFDPRVTARTIWKGVTNLTAKDVGEGIGDVGQMYLMGKAAGAVEPETVRGVINTGLRGADKVGQGITAVGDATMPSAPIAAAYGAMSKSPSAAAVALLPPALKFGGKGISAISRALQSEPPPAPPVPPSPAQSLGMNAEGGFTAGAGATSTGAATPPPAPGAGTQPWTVPQPPRPEPPPVTGTGTLITKPTPGPGTEPWTATRPAEPPPIVPPQTGTASPETVMGSPNVGWNQWTPGRDVVPAPKVPPEPNTLVTAPDLQQMLEQVQQQLANEPVTKESGPPPRTTTAGGRPSVTQAEYDALQEAAAQRRLAVEDELGAQAEKPAAASVAKEPPKGTDTIPSREQMTPDELSRAREGARDSPDRQPGETVEDYRLRTAGRATGEKSAEPSIIPARRAGAIDDTIESMYERNATDQEFRDYLAKSKNHPKNGEIAAKIESKAHSYKRPSPLAHVIAGAALTGAALRQALVGQLQGDDKQEQD